MKNGDIFKTNDVIIVKNLKDKNLYLYYFLDYADRHLGNVCSIYPKDDPETYYYTTTDVILLATKEDINNLDWGK